MSTTTRLDLGPYEDLARAGSFDHEGRDVELMRGEVRDMTPPGPEHDQIVALLDRWSHSHMSSDLIAIRIQMSIRIPGLQSAPQPDLAWVVARDYRRQWPAASDVHLLIEVAESSLAYDRGEKLELYAAAGIADYWIVNLREQLIEVYRDPTGNRYRSSQSYRGNQELRPLVAADIVLRPGDLWPPES